MLKLLLFTVLVALVAAWLDYDAIASAAAQLAIVFGIVWVVMLILAPLVAGLIIRMHNARQRRSPV